MQSKKHRAERVAGTINCRDVFTAFVPRAFHSILLINLYFFPPPLPLLPFFSSFSSSSSSSFFFFSFFLIKTTLPREPFRVTKHPLPCDIYAPTSREKYRTTRIFASPLECTPNQSPWPVVSETLCAMRLHTHTHTHTYKEGTRGVQEYTQVAQNVFVRALIKL